MARLAPYPPPMPPASSNPNTRVRDFGFPPNREIKHGEPICTLCGSGYSTHEDGSRSHPYQGPLPLSAWIAKRIAQLFGVDR